MTGQEYLALIEHQLALTKSYRRGERAGLITGMLLGAIAGFFIGLGL